MPKKSNLKWWDDPWNPISGCYPISKGCDNCYAQDMAYKFQAMGKEKYRNGFEVTLHPDTFDEPTRWRKQRKIFACDMSDLFNDKVPFEFVDKVMAVIKSTPRHTYYILTKRAERMAQYFEMRPVPTNAWLGVTVEVMNTKERIDYLRNIDATVKFLSCEPLLEDLGTMNLQGIDWIIVGGENEAGEIASGKARQMKKEWVLSIKNQCDEQNIAFFFKQWGMWGEDGIRRNTTTNGFELNGEIYDAMPNEWLLF
jgi:protein gp37